MRSPLCPRACLALALLLAGLAASAAPPLARLRLPPGFHVSLFAGDVAGARSMALGPKGTLFVGTRGEGKVYAIRNDGRHATKVLTIASGLEMPNGVAMRGGDLYVAEVSRILRFPAIEDRLDDPPRPEVVYDKYPHDRAHGWKFIAFGPDGRLYVPVGAPCNICDPKPPYASITRLAPDGSGMEVYASGIRNSVGFDWDPRTHELWFTDNGRDRLGDDVPSDELDHAPHAGMDFGYPYCHAGDVPDPKYGGGQHPCGAFTPPARKLGPHVAALGMRFYTGSMFPAAYRNRVFIAEHGSWNRSRKIGYRVMRATIEDGKVTAYSVFAEGWLDPASQTAWGRPVDVQGMPDGALLVSDDTADAIYRIAYGKP